MHAETVLLDMAAIFSSALYVGQYEELIELEASAAANHRICCRIFVRRKIIRRPELVAKFSQP
jgi:hypothetical protein